MYITTGHSIYFERLLGRRLLGARNHRIESLTAGTDNLLLTFPGNFDVQTGPETLTFTPLDDSGPQSYSITVPEGADYPFTSGGAQNVIGVPGAFQTVDDGINDLTYFTRPDTIDTTGVTRIYLKIRMKFDANDIPDFSRMFDFSNRFWVRHVSGMFEARLVYQNGIEAFFTDLGPINIDQQVHEYECFLDVETGYFSFKRDGVHLLNSPVSFTPVPNADIGSSQIPSFLGRFNGDLLWGLSTVESYELYFGDILLKTIGGTAAEVNADPWKTGSDAVDAGPFTDLGPITFTLAARDYDVIDNGVAGTITIAGAASIGWQFDGPVASQIPDSEGWAFDGPVATQIPETGQ